MIVLTGSIATGKSSTCKILKKHGFTVVDADEIAKKLIDAKVIKKLFGSKYVNGNEIDRKALGNLIFNNSDKREMLNSYIHPLIREEIYKQVLSLEVKKIKYIVDIPLYFESAQYDAKMVILVYCPKELQIKRLMSRDGLNYHDALIRVNSQMNIEEKKRKADYIIDNSSNEIHLESEVEKFMVYLTHFFLEKSRFS